MTTAWSEENPRQTCDSERKKRRNENKGNANPKLSDAKKDPNEQVVFITHCPYFALFRVCKVWVHTFCLAFNLRWLSTKI